MDPNESPAPSPAPEVPAPAPDVPAAAPAAEAPVAEAETALSGEAAAIADAGGAAVLTADEEEEKRKRRRMAFLLFLLLLLISLLTLLSIWYLVYRRPINDLIPPVGQNNPPSYLYSIYGANRPMGVAVAGNGARIYVTESTGERVVRVFDGAGSVVGTLQPPTDGKPHTPVYVAVDQRDGDVYVTDRATGAIYVYDSSGRYLRAFSPKMPIDGWQPLGIALSPGGAWWVSDLSAPFHRIEVFSQDGTMMNSIGSQGQFDYPNMIAFDATGNAYVTDANNGRLVMFDAAGQQLATVGRGASPGNLGLPRGVAVDSVGRLYVVDATGQVVHLYRVGSSGNPRPSFIDEFGTQGIGDGQFEYPNGVAVDSRDRIYVTDRENNRVQVWGY